QFSARVAAQVHSNCRRPRIAEEKAKRTRRGEGSAGVPQAKAKTCPEFGEEALRSRRRHQSGAALSLKKALYPKPATWACPSTKILSGRNQSGQWPARYWPLTAGYLCSVCAPRSEERRV